MKILGISGSPAKGITLAILDKALEGARSKGAVVERIVLNDLNFRPCQECGGCDKTGVCILEDDLTPIYRKLQDADVIIVASPVFFGTISAQLKMMIDRLQAFWVKKHILKKADIDVKKKGVFLCAAALDKKEFFENAKKIVNILFATVNAEYCAELFIFGIGYDKSSNKKDDALSRAFEIGRAIV